MDQGDRIEKLQQFQFRAMNTDIDIVLLCTDEEIQYYDKHIYNWFNNVELQFSRFLPDSELSRLNRKAGELCMVSKNMQEVLLLAESYTEKTDGIFNIRVYDALQHAGYNKSFEVIKGTEVKFTPFFFSTESTFINIDSLMSSVRMAFDLHIDLGGIAKGWAVQRLIESLKRTVPRGLVNAGGDLSVWGGVDKKQPWLIGVENPWKEEEEMGCVSLLDGAMATSSILGRLWLTDQGVKHHLIDPRSMKPSDSEVVQCTVLGKDVIECEIWSKVVCILGIEEGMKLLKKQAPNLEALIFTNQQKVHFYGSEASWAKQWTHVPVDVFHHSMRSEEVR